MIEWSIRYGSYILTPPGLIGMWLVGRKMTSGWIMSLVTQALWLVYAVITRQWGFVPAVAGYSFVYQKNLRSWIRADRTAREEPDDARHGS